MLHYFLAFVTDGQRSVRNYFYISLKRLSRLLEFGCDRLFSMMDAAHQAAAVGGRARISPDPTRHSATRFNDTLINAADSDLLSYATRDPARPIRNNHSKHTLIRFIYSQCLKQRRPSIRSALQSSCFVRSASEFIGFFYLFYHTFLIRKLTSRPCFMAANNSFFHSWILLLTLTGFWNKLPYALVISDSSFIIKAPDDGAQRNERCPIVLRLRTNCYSAYLI